MIKKTFSLLLLLFLCVIVPTQAAVWKATKKWTEQEEKHYQHWVKTNWTEEFFMDPKKPLYYKVEHDCADAVYLMRLIYAYEKKLPFVIHNAHKKGGLTTNNMKNWDRLPEFHRMRKFMDYVTDTTSTKTLRHDTYPIALNNLKPGDIYVAPGVHSYQIVNITETGVAEVMASTTPKAPRFLSRISSFPFYIPEDRKNKSDGYRRFIQPQHIRKSMTKQPHYNDEQYRIAANVKYNYVEFTDIIARRLGKRPEKVAEKTLRLLIALCMYSNDRSVYIYDALWHLQKIRKAGRQCMTRQEYDSYSTPSRDKRLRAFFVSVKQHLDKTWRLNSQHEAQIIAATIFRKTPPPPKETKLTNDFCMVEMSLGEGYYMPLRELWQNIRAKQLVSDPHAPLEARWGINTKNYKPTCRTY